MTLTSPPSLYNQSLQSDDEFVTNFVARREVLETLSRRLEVNGAESDGQHQILIGTRGMGKTSLLRRLAIEINRSTELSSRFIPLMFREEQYNVLCLRDFWKNCGESLAEWAEAHGNVKLAAQLDDALCLDAWADDEGAADQFLAEMNALGKRAVLMVDNLDLIVDALNDTDRWTLRSSLQLRDGPIIIGAATQSLRESADRNAAFYEFFQPSYLEPLSLPETERCMRALALGRGECGKRVVSILNSDPARLKVLHRLTGGNPRVLALTYRFLETTDTNNAMGDLEGILDEVTPYYKARIEEYQTPLQRATIDAIALHWDPITTGQLSKITGLPSTTLSPQLIRLRKDGLIESTETSGSYSGHQITERFLNIWYLMRHGTRRNKQRMRWLVAFLSSFYSSNDLDALDREARATGLVKSWTKDYADAFEQAKQRAAPDLNEHLYPAMRKSVKFGQNTEHTTAFIEDAMEMIDEYITLRQSNDAGAEVEVDVYDALIARLSDSTAPELKEQVAKAMVNKGVSFRQSGDAVAAIKTYDVLIACFCDSAVPGLQEQVARAMVNKGVALSKRGDAVAEIETYDELITRFGGSTTVELQEQVAKAIFYKGITLDQLGDVAAAIETYDALIERFDDSTSLELQEQVAGAMVSKGTVLGQNGDAAAIEIYDTLIVRFGDSTAPELQEKVAGAMVNKGVAFGKFGDAVAAIEAYDELIARFGDSTVPELQEQVAGAMINKGALLGQNSDAEAAIQTYDALIARFGDSSSLQLQEQVAGAMVNKGVILGQGGDVSAAIETFDVLIAFFGDSTAPELQGQVAGGMVNKGIALGQGGDAAAAIEAYDALIARFGDSNAPELQGLVAGAMVNKGVILGQNGDAAAEIEIYDALIVRFGDSTAPELQEQVAVAMVNKGITLGQSGDEAAIGAYDALIVRFGESNTPELQKQVARSMVNKGVTLSQYGDMVAAIGAYDALIVRFGESNTPELQKLVARSMVNKGVTLSQYGDMVAAIETYDVLIARFSDSTVPELQEQVARAMVNKGVVLGQIGDAAAVEAYDVLITRFGDSTVPELQKQVARAMVNKGVVLGQIGDVAAIETYDELITRFGDSSAPELQEQVVKAMVNKGATLGNSGNAVAEIETYDALIARFGDSTVPKLLEQISKAMVNKGVALGQCGDAVAEIETYEQALALMQRLDTDNSERDGSDIAIRLGNALFECGIDKKRSEALFLQAAEYNPLSAYANLFWLYISTERVDEAKQALHRLDKLPLKGRALIDSALAFEAENFGEATVHMHAALAEDLADGDFDFTDDVERLIRLAIAKGFGERLIAWFEKTRLAERYAPIHVALLAAVRGEKMLLDSNPEVRQTASEIYLRLIGGNSSKKGIKP